jgi:hypothetical protein
VFVYYCKLRFSLVHFFGRVRLRVDEVYATMDACGAVNSAHDDRRGRLSQEG